LAFLFVCAGDLPADSKALAVQKEREAARSAADRVLVALERKDAKQLARLARIEHTGEWRDRTTKGCDPWLVADELCVRGEFDAALAFARASSRPDVLGLPAYVAARRKRPTTRERRVSHGRVLRAWSEGRIEDVLSIATAAASGTPPPDVIFIETEYARGWALKRLGRYAESSAVYDAVAEAAEGIGWLARAAQCHGRAAYYAAYVGDYPAAVEGYGHVLGLQRRRGSRDGVERALSNLGGCLAGSGRFRESLERYREVLGLYEESSRTESWKKHEVARTLHDIAEVHVGCGNYADALVYLDRAHRHNVRNGNSAYQALNLALMGRARAALGDYPRAIELVERAFAIEKQTTVRRASHIEQLGRLHLRIGEHQRALELLERALAMQKASNHRAAIAALLESIARVHQACRDLDTALRYAREAQALYVRMADRAGAARIRQRIGLLHVERGDPVQGRELLEQSLEVQRAIGHRAAEASTLDALGSALRAMEDVQAARNRYSEALAVATAAGARDVEIRSRWHLAALELEAGRPSPALKQARAAVELVPSLVRGLSDEQGAMAREQWIGLFEVGAEAAIRCGDLAAACFFLESGRAGALREALGGAEAMQACLVPRSLAMEEAGARRLEAVAFRQLQRALAEGGLEDIEERRNALAEARMRVVRAMARIRRKRKAAADVYCSAVDELATIQERLHPHQVLVLYAVLPSDAYALVVASDSVRLVCLGRSEAIERLPVGSDLDQRSLQKMASRLLAPLKLAPGVEQVIVAPHAATSQVPFAALATDRQFICVPSGTTYGLLQELAQTAGEGVLGVGDPAYGDHADSRAIEVLRSGEKLVPLPSARREIEEIADVRLLGRDATETGLRTILDEPRRWRSIHIACHGSINSEYPMLSSLALRADERNDGFLTAQDVLGIRTNADLVVLSACETARGKVYRGEGVAGLARSFMLAGAPRIIVSLWKVDDDATRALMVKFYALWKGGTSAAAALRGAQEHVRARKRWRHPRYWAAWQLWGLPD
jgi:CHAT domain-containing protein